MEIDTDNKEWQSALHIINDTSRSLFLTGKAGTGKSTFLRHVAGSTKKKHVILAPTGMSAINAGGSTLHSFFRIPLHPLIPTDSRYNTRNIRKTLKYNGNHCKLLREVELIIIDEISMVRADIIDFIDKVLRIYCRNMREPFGGKQMLLIGDIYQLEPVVTEEDRKLLHPFYETAFFFGAKVFQEMRLVSIELQKVYRQTDKTFISILDHIRNNTAGAAELQAINARVGAELSLQNGKMAITLASHRDTVDYINGQQLMKLDGDPIVFHGTIEGEFPLASLPSPMELQVKVGAQIIFIKNDKDKRWVNGTIGVISAIDENHRKMSVVTEDGNEYDVAQDIWENIRYTFNEKEQKIEEQQLGIYKQFPMRLAWAITIHKSQGLTFRQVNIDFSGGVFAGGQAYVALSRCTSLDGLRLNAPIRTKDIFVRPEVIRFAKQYNDRATYAKAMQENLADIQYREAAKAFDRDDFNAFLDFFFKAIHNRYDIEKPVAKRYILKKLSIIKRLKEEKQSLEDEIHRKDEYLKKLSAEYTLLGKECEMEHMDDAAIANYSKAIELYPMAFEAKRRIEALAKQ